MATELRAYNAKGEQLFITPDADGPQFEAFETVGAAFDRMEALKSAWRWDAERAGYVAADGFVRNRIAYFRLDDEHWTREQVAAHAQERAARKAAMAATADDEEAAQEAQEAPQERQERPAAPVEPTAPATPQEAAPFKPVRLHFEMEVCGRCGGTGEHQYNQRDGHVCWGCSGTKERMTRRANTAYDAYQAALPETAAATYVRDLAPGMVIRSKAHGGLSGAKPWDYKHAWRRVESVRFEEVTGRGCVKGMIVDVACVQAEITFADGKTWTAVSSDDPAYWNRGAFHTIYTERCFRLAGEEARRALDEVRRAIARRFTGAWLEGEEPPAPAERKPRAPKPAPAADGQQQTAAPAPRPANAYPGDCRLCGARVPAQGGERLKVDGRWAVQHRDGECPAADGPQEAQEVPQERQERPAAPNRYAGRCQGCGGRVAAGAGVRVRDGGAWVTRHREGDCQS